MVVTADGYICFVSRVVGGSESDKTHCNVSCFPDMLEEKYGGGRKEKDGDGEEPVGEEREGEERRGEEREGEEREGEEDIFVLGGDKAYRGMRRPLGCPAESSGLGVWNLHQQLHQ